MLVGSILKEGDALYNIVALLDGGKIVAIRKKHELPNYGTFDEKRIFASGPLPEPVRVSRSKAGPADLRGWLAAAVCAHLKATGCRNADFGQWQPL